MFDCIGRGKVFFESSQCSLVLGTVWRKVADEVLGLSLEMGTKLVHLVLVGQSVVGMKVNPKVEEEFLACLQS